MTHDFLPIVDDGSEALNGLTSIADHCPFMPVFGAPSVMFVRGEGTQLWDSHGRRYLDFLSGIAVTSLGHAHPTVADAIAKQARELVHVSNFFSNPIASRAAIAVNQLMYGATGCHGQLFFCNSGAEANEAAIKLARKFGGRGRHVVVSALGSFHGRTLGALAATGQPTKHEPFQPMPEGFRHVEYGSLDALDRAIDPSVSAVLLEPLQGEGGVVPAPDGYLQGVERICRDRGLLLMIDEVQTGFSRTGKWFGFEHSGIHPDVVTFAKGMGNGFPVGAVWAKREVASVFVPGDHGSTYSGTALAGAAVLAVIDEMKRINAPSLAHSKGRLLTDHLQQIQQVVGVRGSGLLLGVELATGLDSKAVASELLSRGLVVNAVTSTALRLAPPITTSEAEIEEAVNIMRDVLE